MWSGDKKSLILELCTGCTLHIDDAESGMELTPKTVIEACTKVASDASTKSSQNATEAFWCMRPSVLLACISIVSNVICNCSCCF